ncbi:MAG: hypothetical protein IT427_16755 [Pirellulales bacterium]|nr:hypothetical protein [Pirellulales bacterium]
MSTQQVIDESVGATQQSEAERIFERLGPFFDEERMRIARLLASKPDSELFGQTEYELRDRVHHLGAKSLEAAADERQKKGGYEGASLVCPHCQQDARFVNRRPKRATTLLGSIRFRRPYDHCARCGRGLFPWDQTLGVDGRGFTPAAQELVRPSNKWRCPMGAAAWRNSSA